MVKKLMGGAVSSTGVLCALVGLVVVGLVVVYVIIPEVNKSTSQTSKHNGGAAKCSSCPYNNS